MTAAFDAELAELRDLRDERRSALHRAESDGQRWKLRESLRALDAHIRRYEAIAAIPTVGEAA